MDRISIKILEIIGVVKMAVCFSCGKEISPKALKCRYCLAESFPDMPQEVMLSSTSEFVGYEIIEYMGIAYGEAVCPNGIFGALTSGTFFTHSAVAQARANALAGLVASARNMSANAVVGVDIDICDLNGGGSFVSANGTAVYIVPKDFVEKQCTMNVRKEAWLKQQEEFRLQQKLQFEEQRKLEEERRIREEEFTNALLSDAHREISSKNAYVAKSIIKEMQNQDEVTVSSLVRDFARDVDPELFKSAFDELVEKNIIKVDDTGICRLCVERTDI